MKEIKLFYAEVLGKYIINEDREKNSNVPSENIKNSISEAFNFVLKKYEKRKILLDVDVPEKDYALLEEKIKNTKIELK